MALSNHIYHRIYITKLKNRRCGLIIFPAPVINIDWESKCGSNWKEKDRVLFMVSLYLNAEWTLGKVWRQIIGQPVKQMLSFDLTRYKRVNLRRPNRDKEGTTGFLSHYKHRGSHSRNPLLKFEWIICHPDWIFVVSFRTSRKMSGECPKFRQTVLLRILCNKLFTDQTFHINDLSCWQWHYVNNK
jgi:hypothetical protein